jgi:hypothetical protein
VTRYATKLENVALLDVDEETDWTALLVAVANADVPIDTDCDAELVN